MLMIGVLISSEGVMVLVHIGVYLVGVASLMFGIRVGFTRKLSLLIDVTVTPHSHP